MTTLVLTACGADVQFPGNDPDAQDSKASSTSDCKGLVNETFVTTFDQPGTQARCGYDAFQNYSCSDTFGSWLVQFDSTNRFFWSTGDTSSSGIYTCSNGKIVGTPDGNRRPVNASVSGATLTWKEVIYLRAD
ncbi:MAG: hypothetical protein H7Z43_11085 [Clostridia bacterium]|nr:hypothetical protein [Deltaproteobacteria bacterium]